MQLFPLFLDKENLANSANSADTPLISRRVQPHQLLPAITLVSNHPGPDKRQQTDIQEPIHMILEQLKKNTELLTAVITQIDSQEKEIAIIKEKIQSFESSCFTGQKNLKSVKKAKEVPKAVSCKL